MRSSDRGGQRRAPGVLKCGPWPVAHVLIYGAGKVRRSLNRFVAGKFGCLLSLGEHVLSLFSV